MPQQISNEQFLRALEGLLEETFEKVAGIYLDRSTSMFETLGGISASEASRPLVPGGTSIAAHVEHLRFYMKVMEDYMAGKWYDNLDWKQSWVCSTVNDKEWDTLREQLKVDYQRVRALVSGVTDWNEERRLGGALGIVVHTAYHLGAIRQILRVAKK